MPSQQDLPLARRLTAALPDRLRDAAGRRLGVSSASELARGARRLTQLAYVVLAYGLLPALVPPRRRTLSGPVRLRRALEDLGGTWIKLGQTLALRFDLLPPAYCHELFGLLNRVAPFPSAEVDRIVRTELGRDVGEVFASFAPEPFGAASIGQVHDAVLPSGMRVAVKVQRPGIERLITTDIALMYRVSRLLDLTRVFGGTRTRDVIDEFARWTREELDYTVEAANALAMRAQAGSGETAYHPDVFPEYTTSRVLTAERLDGILLVEVIRDLQTDRPGATRRLRAAGYDLDQVATNIVWNFLHQVYAVGVFHGDLHPANLLILPGNRIGYVDFGIIGRLTEPVRKSLVRYSGSLFAGEVDEAIRQFLRWVAPSPATDVPAATREMVGLTERFLDALERAADGKRQIMARYQEDLLEITRTHRMAIDPAVVLYMKVVLTIDSVTSALSPALDLQDLHGRFFRELILEGIQAAQAERLPQPATSAPADA
ncbi:MAG: ubiquinone biosynthesis protein [Solirubrobacteraceae bacterium]|nr:ubiquinone biosynthesis protein [Solirubrobacteraceae bacterium]